MLTVFTTIKYDLKGGREGGKEGENKGTQERNLRVMMEKLVGCLSAKSKLLSPPVRQEHGEGQWGPYGNAERELTCRASSRALITRTPVLCAFSHCGGSLRTYRGLSSLSLKIHLRVLPRSLASFH